MSKIGSIIATRVLILLAPVSCLSVQHAETKIDVGVCITGLARTFSYKQVRENVRTKFLAPFLGGLSYRSFFVLGGVDDPRQHSQVSGNISALNFGDMKFPLEPWNGASVILEDGQKIMDHWGDFDAPKTRHHMKFWPQGKAMRNFSGGGCHHRRGDVSRWASMQTRMHNCLHLIKEFESARSTSFDKIMFTRPDLVFLGAVPRLVDLQLKPQDIMIPKGVVLQQYNDHMFVCSSEHCSPYFDMLEVLESGNMIKLHIGLCNSDVLDSIMFPMLTHFNLRRVSLPYTLVRPCPVGPECRRLENKKAFNVSCNTFSEQLCAGDPAHRRKNP